MKKNWPIIAGSIILSVIVIFYFSVFHSGLSKEDTNWANFGSYVGGSAGSIFSFITLVYVVKSFNQEKEEKKEAAKELKEQKKEREREKNETSFYKSLDLLFTCVSNLLYRDIFNETTEYKSIAVLSQYNHVYTDKIILFKKYRAKNSEDMKRTLVFDYETEYISLHNSISPFIDISKYIMDTFIKSNFSYSQTYKTIFISALQEVEKDALIYTGAIPLDFLKDIKSKEDIDEYNALIMSFKEYEKFVKKE